MSSISTFLSTTFGIESRSQLVNLLSDTPGFFDGVLSKDRISQISEFASGNVKKQRIYLKFLNDDLINRGLKYKLGLNVDPIPFTTDDCSAGGIYFTDLKNHKKWSGCIIGQTVAFVTIPEDAKVHREKCGTKLKADKVEIVKIFPGGEYWIVEYLNLVAEHGDDESIFQSFSLIDCWEKFISLNVVEPKHLTPRFCKLVVSINPNYLIDLDKTPELCKIAVSQAGNILRIVENQTEDICLAAVTSKNKNTDSALLFVKDQTESVCIAAVSNIPESLKYVVNQTDAICLAAVKKSGNSLRFVRVHTEEICLAAVTQSGRNLEYVRYQTPRICLAAVTQDSSAIEFLVEQTQDLCMVAISKGKAGIIWFVKDQTPEICLAAVTRDGVSVDHIIDQSPEVCMAAVKQTGMAIKEIRPRRRTSEIMMAAVTQNGLALEHIKLANNQPMDICIAAISQNVDAFKYVIGKENIAACKATGLIK